MGKEQTATPRAVNLTDATPRPWKRQCFLITNATGRDHLAHTGVGSNLPPSRSHESEANAELIVKAVNSFESNQATIAALRDALTTIADQSERATMVQDRSVGIIKMVCAEIAKVARAALGDKQ